MFSWQSPQRQAKQFRWNIPTRHYDQDDARPVKLIYLGRTELRVEFDTPTSVGALQSMLNDMLLALLLVFLNRWQKYYGKTIIWNSP
jgi:hypothetical protein